MQAFEIDKPMDETEVISVSLAPFNWTGGKTISDYYDLHITVDSKERAASLSSIKCTGKAVAARFVIDGRIYECSWSDLAEVLAPLEINAGA